MLRATHTKLAFVLSIFPIKRYNLLLVQWKRQGILSAFRLLVQWKRHLPPPPADQKGTTFCWFNGKAICPPQSKGATFCWFNENSICSPQVSGASWGVSHQSPGGVRPLLSPEDGAAARLPTPKLPKAPKRPGSVGIAGVIRKRKNKSAKRNYT